ncbi:hypothetical protein MCC93_18070 [Morococcus cerebrosus]|uniref:Uncharacterized protein n=1 Tax=Morococcus cerebrosus TaxID=1056807 RepID=A0A0C1GK01_9NEIS|nr:hypothetical protein MCC93_18070 [Morococcus cerebrosus]
MSENLKIRFSDDLSSLADSFNFQYAYSHRLSFSAGWNPEA